MLALDVPSGLDATQGTAYDPTIQAVATLTLALPKAGLLAPQAARCVGELYLADIGVPPELYSGLSLQLRGGTDFSASEIPPVALIALDTRSMGPYGQKETGVNRPGRGKVLERSPWLCLLATCGLVHKDQLAIGQPGELSASLWSIRKIPFSGSSAFREMAFLTKWSKASIAIHQVFSSGEIKWIF